MAGSNPITAAHPAASAGRTPDPRAILSIPDQDSLQSQSAEDFRSHSEIPSTEKNVAVPCAPGK